MPVGFLINRTAEHGDDTVCKDQVHSSQDKTSDQISLLSLTKIAMALDIADELRNIFSQVPYRDIKEVINETR